MVILNSLEEDFLKRMLTLTENDLLVMENISPETLVKSNGEKLLTPQQEKDFDSYINALHKKGFIEKLHDARTFSDICGCYFFSFTTDAIAYFEEKDKQEQALKAKRETKIQRKKYDVFISHANKDKLDYVNDLVNTLKNLGINIFYDKDEFEWGDNWKEKILNGTEQSEFAIIVISDNFFDREWTEKELNEFLHRQNESGQKIILPLLYGITCSDVSAKYPELEFIQSLKADDHSKEEIAILLARQLIKRYKGE